MHQNIDIFTQTETRPSHIQGQLNVKVDTYDLDKMIFKSLGFKREIGNKWQCRNLDTK